jgi:hypothetical protein
MNRYIFTSTLTLMAALAACACSSDSKESTSTPEGGEPTGTGGKGGGTGGSDAGTQSETGATSTGFKLEWNVSDGQALVGDAGPDAGAGPLPGVKVCVHDHSEIACVTTDAAGAFTLKGLPPLTALVLTLDKDGYNPESKTIETASTDMSVSGAGILMFSTANGLPAGATQDPKNGSVDFLAIGPAPDDPNSFVLFPDVSVTLSPSAGAGPYIFTGHGQLIEGRKTTSDGLGFYYDLPPGDYELAFDEKGFDCVGLAMPLAAWGIPENPNKVKFTVLPGYLTDEVLTFCTQASVIIGADE